MQSVIKTHYSSSVNRSYPLQLLDIDYTIDRYKNKFLSQPKHERGIFIHYLDLTSWSNIIDSIQNILVNKSSYQIKHLIVNEHPEVNNEFLDFLSQSEIIIQCLNQLEIRKCLLININGIKLINKLTNLQVLDISFYPLIDDEMIKNMFIQLNKLHSINLSNCRLITNDSLSHISELAADRLLNIELANNTLITQVGINKIILKCELLEVLNISKCININFIGIVLNTHGSYQFVSRKIKKLIIDGCIHLHDMSLKWIAIALPDLIEVSMKNIPTITNIIIEGIVRGCFQLKILNCNGCKSITNNSIQYISTIIKNKESESKLNTNLTHLYLAKIHNNIISLDLVDILYYCKALHTIDLSSNSSITDNIFIDLLKLSSSDSIVVYTLHSINISLTSITSYGIACMVQVLTKLEEINISGLKHIDDSALKVIAACCPSIRIIHANDCKGLTDEGIIYLAKYCKYLQVLQLSYTSIVIDMKTTGGETYTQYTDKSIKALFTYAKYLKELSLCNQLNLSFTSHWFKNTLRRVGNYSIQKLDFRGCNSMDEKYLGLFLRFCYALNDVYLPAKFLDTDVSKVKFWRSAFQMKRYVIPYSLKHIQEEKQKVIALLTKVISTKKESIVSTNKIEMKSLKNLEGFHILQPHALKDSMQYRDHFSSRRLLECYSVRMIQHTYKAYLLWKHIRCRVNARKIAIHYKRYLIGKQRAVLINNFMTNLCAKKIQRQFFTFKLLYSNAARCIQKRYRNLDRVNKNIFIKYQNKVIIQIQRIARGYIVRVSEQYILSQIYLKLPFFWKEVMKIKPVHMKEEHQKRINKYEITELKEETSRMLTHILDNVVQDRILPPKLPFIVPQPFDKSPYIALSDGRRLNFDIIQSSFFSKEYLEATKDHRNFVLDESSSKHLMNQKQIPSNAMKIEQKKIEDKHDVINDLNKKEPIHPFTLKYWPLTKPSKVEDTSTSEHNAALNSFDIIKNSKTLLACEICDTRLRVIHCNTCFKGYCFFCAHRTHSDAFKRYHDMQLMEPRIVEYKKVENSLVYHIDMATSVVHDLSYLVKYMRSASEVNRIQKERQLLKDFERQEEEKRIAYLKAMSENKDQHEGATRIILLYHSKKSKRIVKEKKIQKVLEVALNNEIKYNNAIITIQKIVRMVLIRKWFHKHGYYFYVAKKDRDKARLKHRKKNRKSVVANQLPYEELNQIMEKAIRIRRYNTRQNLFYSLEKEFSHVMEIVQTNIDYWLKQYQKMVEETTKLVTLRDSYFELHQNEQVKASKSTLSATTTQRKEIETSIKGLKIKLDLTSERVENSRNKCWWITQHMRSLYRRQSVLSARLSDTLLRIEWTSEEHMILNRIEFHMNERINALKKANVELHSVADWVSRYLDYILIHQSTLDSLQETILKEELNRLARDERITIEFDSLISELLQAIHADNQYIAERVYLEVNLKSVLYGSTRAIELNKQLVDVKNKQKQLNSYSIDSLKAGLQKKYDDEDDRNISLYGFPNDSPELEVSQMSTIQASMIEHFVPSKHCTLTDFLSVYLIQPWLSEQSIEDVRIEETISSMELRANTFKEKIRNIKSELKSDETKKRNIEQRIKEINKELIIMLDPPEGEIESEKKERLETIANFKQEEIGLKTEIALIEKNKITLHQEEPPIQTEIENITIDINRMQLNLNERIIIREKSSKLLFDLEEKISLDLIDIIEKIDLQIEEMLLYIERQINLCELYSGELSDSNIQNIIDNKDIEFIERVMINIPLQTPSHIVQALYHILSPRLTPSDKQTIRRTIQTHLLIIQTNQIYYQQYKDNIKNELNNLKSFHNNRKLYELSQISFNKVTVQHRRQRSLQREIDLRKKRLDIMRNERLKTMKHLKDIQLKEEAKSKANRDANLAKKQTFSQIIAKKTKQTIRDAKDTYRNLKYANDTAMDEEEQKMAMIIREKNKDGIGNKPEGIREFQFTVGKLDTDNFQKQNDRLREKGLPFFRKMARSLGNQLYLWYQSTFDSSLFITDFKLGHKDPDHPNYLDLSNDKTYTCIDCTTNPSKLQIWVKKDRHKRKGIKDVGLSFTEAEEVRMLVDHFEKVDITLSEFGLPDTYLWLQRVEKKQAVDVTNTNAMIAEVKKVKDMLANRPEDINLQALMDRMGKKLEAAYDKEKRNVVTNPLQASIDMMALTEEDVSKWLKVYQRIDIKGIGKVSFDEIFDYFECQSTDIAKEIFHVMESVDKDGSIEFGDFIRSCGAFCLYGKIELLKFLYVFIDKDRTNAMGRDMFKELIDKLNPYDKIRALRAFKELKLKADTKITIKEFLKINERFPACFYPIFALQDSMRAKTMGIDWWFNKMEKFKNVRRKMVSEGDNVEKLVELELERFQEDDTKEKRMAERALLIKQETSEIRKVMLQAKQFLDEFS